MPHIKAHQEIRHRHKMNKQCKCVCAKFLSRVRLPTTPFTDCSLPGFPVHGLLQAIILKWIAISFSKQTTSVSNTLRKVVCLFPSPPSSIPIVRREHMKWKIQKGLTRKVVFSVFYSTSVGGWLTRPVFHCVREHFKYISVLNICSSWKLWMNRLLKALSQITQRG